MKKSIVVGPASGEQEASIVAMTTVSGDAAAPFAAQRVRAELAPDERIRETASSRHQTPSG